MVGWLRAILLAAVLTLSGAAGAQAGVLVIDGAGDGHGVGMSQTGAEGLALHGYGTQQILTHYYTGTTIGWISPGHLVTVLLQSRLRAVVFSGATQAGRRPLRSDHTYIATAGRGGAIALESEHGRLLAYLPAPLELTSAGPISFDGAASNGVIDGRYRGSLVLRLDRGRVDVINRVGLESYVRGVVAAESPSYWPAAELEAQAVAARTYAFASAPENHVFDLYADTRSQQYGGVSAETPATDAATRATRDEVVTYHGRPVVTYYFASSGGATEDAQYGLPDVAPEPWLVGVLDPFDAVRYGPITLTLHEADARLHGLLRGTLRAIEVTARGVSPRIVRAKLVGSAGTTLVSGTQLEGALGLASTWACFTVSTSTATVAAGWDRACERPSKLAPATAVPLGSSGTREPTGSHGPTGSSGSHGPTGSSGSRGPSGSSGSRGPSGSSGSRGPSGSHGPTGSSGSREPTAPIGTTGGGTTAPPGATGVTGTAATTPAPGATAAGGAVGPPG